MFLVKSGLRDLAKTNKKTTQRRGGMKRERSKRGHRDKGPHLDRLPTAKLRLDVKVLTSGFYNYDDATNVSRASLKLRRGRKAIKGFEKLH